MFEKQTGWTALPCYYVMAYHGNWRAWLAGPYRTADEADAALPVAITWELQESGDPLAGNYRYAVFQNYHGQTASILGEFKP